MYGDHFSSTDIVRTFSSRWPCLSGSVTCVDLASPEPVVTNNPGHAATSSSAISPVTGLRSTTSGLSLYQAVATGDHLACSRPTPFTQCASNLMHCPGESFANRISSCTGPMLLDMSPCPHANRHDVSSGNSLPAGSHSSALEYTSELTTLPSSLRHCTSSRNTTVFFSLGASSADLNSNRLGSILSGTMPSRWASTSSCRMEVLFIKNTCSAATVGTSAMRIRRSALAMEGSHPIMSNSITSSVSLRTSMRKLSLKSSSE
mmetsp:Transcript_7938/g.14245  ORF Transcript_7938/g.14245 Transcript_7938/m.14245 type:complete len:261 (-) Transcript_7938:636-1418(-)